MMSAFEPCMTKLTATRSPKPRVCRFIGPQLGTGAPAAEQARRVAVLAACAIVLAMNACTCGKRARYASMYACACSFGMSRFSESPNAEIP
jgi:hypothetical protein